MTEQRIFLFEGKDEDTLYNAFAHYISGITKKSINITIAMLHMCIQESVERSGIAVPDAKGLDDEKKKEFIENGIDNYLKKLNLSYIQKSEINHGCMTIYQNWYNIKSSIHLEKDIQHTEFIKDQPSGIIVYNDQEVLFKAFTHYIAGSTGKKEADVEKLIRACISGVTESRKINFKDIRHMDESLRRELIAAGINEYILKANITGSKAGIVLADCLKVYERWKEIRREDPEKEEYSMEDFTA